MHCSYVNRAAIDRSRKGAFTSMIAVEIGWLGRSLFVSQEILPDIFLIGFLWIMWLASAATTANTIGGTLTCDYVACVYPISSTRRFANSNISLSRF